MERDKYSYHKVHYLTRFMKQIERKLIIESLQYLNGLLKIKDYAYFGFGSVYYADFILFHKYLNMNILTSIDNKIEDEKRFLYNRPYNFVKFKICDSSKFLQNHLNWNKKQFMWLDYDSILDDDKIEDIKYIASHSKEFDLFIVTLDGEPPYPPSKFKDSFERLNIDYIKNEDVAKNFNFVLWTLLKDVIKEGCSSNANGVEFLQLYNYAYKDSCKMYSMGGVFITKQNKNLIIDLLRDFKYVSYDKEIIYINCPLLTLREKLQLDHSIKEDKTVNIEEASITGLSEEELKEYEKYYKYYPQFFESLY